MKRTVSGYEPFVENLMSMDNVRMVSMHLRPHPHTPALGQKTAALVHQLCGHQRGSALLCSGPLCSGGAGWCSISVLTSTA